MTVELTIGMATYQEYDALYFTLQALRLYQDLENTELLVVDNFGSDDTRNLVENQLKGRYVRSTEVGGTAAPRDKVFREAQGQAVLVCDSHVLFEPGFIARLKRYYRDHPECNDLLQGPLVYDDGITLSTHMDPSWSCQMWGVWGSDPRGEDPESEPFEIPMQGLGAFSCRRDAWLGFNPLFRGFGGEEGYIHEKFRQAGHRSLCVPWFRWVHRFRPSSSSIPYPLTVENKLRNYILGFRELGLDVEPALHHFQEFLPRERIISVLIESLRDESKAARGEPITFESTAGC
ncbi:MAG: glycosyltransferase family 2 protein [Chloroflexota bacterium]